MNKVKTKPIRRDRRIVKRDFSLFAVAVVGLIVLNILSQQYFFRLDLTEENRYSIAEATKNMLRALDHPVHVTVYLEGDMPAGFQRLQKSIRETLEEFQVYAGDELSFRFVDPLKATDDAGRKDFFLKLNQMGIQQTNLFDEENGQRIQRVIFPGAVVRYNNQEAGVMLLKGDRAASAEETLNQSIENLEYELASAIQKLATKEKKKIGLMRGHGELAADIAGLTQALSEYYQLYEVNLPEKEAVPAYDAIIIGKPTEPFSREDKYKLDQYIMRGGKVMFFLDPLAIDMDSLEAGSSFGFVRDVNLDDQLFKYGVRVNKNLVQDIKSGVYPIVVGNLGEQPQIVSLPWPFFPIVNNYADHPIVRNLDAIYLRFVSSIDTVAAPGVEKTPLIFTSPYSRVLSTPIVVDLQELRQEPDPEAFRSGPQAVAYLLEGTFTSVFKNRILPEIADKDAFMDKSQPTKMIVVADGDLIRSDINPRTNQPMPLGFDMFTKRTFANRAFILNALAYLMEENGLIMARSKEIQIRPLDQVAVDKYGTLWQIVNLGLPILLIVGFGVVKYYVRKRKYARFPSGSA